MQFRFFFPLAFLNCFIEAFFALYNIRIHLYKQFFNMGSNVQPREIDMDNLDRFRGLLPTDTFFRRTAQCMPRFQVVSCLISIFICHRHVLIIDPDIPFASFKLANQIIRSWFKSAHGQARYIMEIK